MKILISHEGNNQGTTNFFRNYLISLKEQHFYLRHPMPSSRLVKSELVYFDGTNEKILNRYFYIKLLVFEYIWSFLISVWVLIKLRNKIQWVIGFGSFNVVPAILISKIIKLKIIFWGVDYSEKRFNSAILNYIYRKTETIASTKSKYIIQPNHRQENIRIKKHGLLLERSIIIPNGINKIVTSSKFRPEGNYAFLYLGSISKKHGVLDFVRKYYIEDDCSIPLYIFGSGQMEAELNGLIKNHSLSDKIYYFGQKSSIDIETFIMHTTCKFIGIAPYSFADKSHLYYGDSLKIKEYLSFKIPFLTSSVVEIPATLIQFGCVYTSWEECSSYVKNPSLIPLIDERSLNSVLEKFTWSCLCALVPKN